MVACVHFLKIPPREHPADISDKPVNMAVESVRTPPVSGPGTIKPDD
jgi:hypothetical protein